jgi:AhpD family alkylhydroperoxidase
MSRLPTIAVEQWPADLVDAMQAADMTHTERGVATIFANSPTTLKAMLAMGVALVGNCPLSPRTQELIRLRLAYLNQCDLCIFMRYISARNDGLTEDHVRQLEDYRNAPDFTEAEKAVLAYVDLTLRDPQSITQATFDDLGRFYSVKEIVEISALIAFYDGFGRLEAILDPVELLPASYQDPSVERAPWRDEFEMVRR